MRFDFIRKVESLLFVRLILLCALISLMSGCSVKNKITEQTLFSLPTAAKVTETMSDANTTKKTESRIISEQSAGANAVTIFRETTEQDADLIIVNLFNDKVYSLPLAAQITKPDDPRLAFVRPMSWSELSEYYKLNIDEKAFADIVRSVSEEKVVSHSYSMCLPSTGIFQEDEKVYDTNVLEYDSKRERITIIFSRNNNILWPGSDSIAEYDPAEGRYGKSRINGIECIIGQPVSVSETSDENFFEIRAELRDTEITIVIDGFSKEQSITLFQKLCAVLMTADTLR